MTPFILWLLHLLDKLKFAILWYAAQKGIQKPPGLIRGVFFR
jgi:hypothetical protein